MKANERIADVVVVCTDVPLCHTLGLSLMDAGYAVVEAATYAAALSPLRAASRPMVVVAVNVVLDCRAEVEFFGQVAADAILARHRYVLLSTDANWLPEELCATLHSLDVPVLRIPSRLDDLLAAVARAAGRVQMPKPTSTQIEDTPVGGGVRTSGRGSPDPPL